MYRAGIHNQELEVSVSIIDYMCIVCLILKQHIETGWLYRPTKYQTVVRSVSSLQMDFRSKYFFRYASTLKRISNWPPRFCYILEKSVRKKYK